MMLKVAARLHQTKALVKHNERVTFAINRIQGFGGGDSHGLSHFDLLAHNRDVLAGGERHNYRAFDGQGFAEQIVIFV